MDFLIDHLEGIATSASIVFATFIAWIQLRRQERIRLEEYTLDFVAQEHNSDQIQKAMNEVYRGILKEADATAAFDDPDLFDAYVIVLSYYTNIAISTKNKLLLSHIVFNNMGAAIIRNFDFLYPFILRMREGIGFSRYCGTLEEMVENELRPQTKTLHRPIQVKRRKAEA